MSTTTQTLTKWARYEQGKQALREQQLTPKEYEQKIKQLAKELEI